MNTAIKTKEDLVMDDGSLILKAGKDGIYSDDLVQINGKVLDIDAIRYGIFGQDGVSIAEGCQYEIKNTRSKIASK